MDNLKKFLTILNKYQFWVICGGILITVIVCWWLATGSLANQFIQRKIKLDIAFKSALVQPNHPNQRVIEKINQQHDVLKRDVLDAWKILYDEQKQKNPLPIGLGEEFKRDFENLQPRGELQRASRERYQNYIKDHLPSLKKMIDVRRPSDAGKTIAAGDAGKSGAKTAGAGPVGGKKDAPGSEQEWIGTVDWNDGDYAALETKFDWKGDTPSTLAVVLAQENLWVYEALLRIIKNSNEGASGYATAAVKRIEALQIGRDAVGAGSTAEGSGFRAGQAASAPPSGAGARQPGGPAGVGAEELARMLMENRYVDDKGKPLPYDAEYPYAKHPYAEFKMMPIRMSLMMDPRRLPKLLVECANSSMPVEVHRVRIVKSQGNAPSAPGGNAPQPPGAVPSKPREGGDTQPSDSSDIPVEVYGVIYIYNPPDRQKLGTGTASAEKPAEAAAPGTTTGAPAASPGESPKR